MAIEGPVKELAIQDLLQVLALARKTGVLNVRSQRLRDEAIIHVHQGDVVFASRGRSGRRLGQQLVRDGKLNDRTLERALDRQRRNPARRLGAILVGMGAVEEEELNRQLRFQIEETVYDLLAWEEGSFRFAGDDDLVAGPVRVRVDALLMEGARRMDEWKRLEPAVPGADAVPVLEPADKGEPIDLRPDEWEVLAAVDGERDVRLIASDLGRSAFDVARAVHHLVRLNIVTVRERSAADRELMALLGEVERMIADGDLEAAEHHTRALLQSHPQSAALQLVTGRLLVAQGRLGAAVEAFDRGVALDPLSLDAHYHLGLAAARSGDFSRAAEAWNSYLRLAPEAGERREHVIAAMDAMGALRQAIEAAPTE